MTVLADTKDVFVLSFFALCALGVIGWAVWSIARDVRSEKVRRSGPPTSVTDVLCALILLGFGPIGWILLALWMDQRKQRWLSELQREKDQRMQAEWEAHVQARLEEQTQVSSSGQSGQVRCNRCGTMNAAELVECWHCGKGLVERGAIRPPDANTLPSKRRQQLRRSPGRSIRSPDAGILPSEPVPAMEPESHPPQSEQAPRKLRVACRSCGKRFSGEQGKIQSLRACPKCGASPFDYRLLPSKQR